MSETNTGGHIVASTHKAVATALLLAVGLVLAPGVGRGVAGAGSAPDGPMMDRTVDGPTRADGFLRVEWSVGATEPGQSRIVGYVYNDYREDAVNVQLRISQLDAAGRPGASVVQPVGDTVRAGGRTFFDLRVAGNGPVYQVAVRSFDFMADGPWTTAATEEFLAAAGFQKVVADTPAKAAHLETLTPARRMVAHRRDGRLYYLYADPEVCKCLYVGTAEQYQLALEKRRESDELVAMQEHLDYDTGTWDLWAPWP